MIESILKTFDNLNIPYCILHGWQSLPENLPSDLDIIIAPESLNTLEQALSSCDGVRIVQLLQHETSCHYFVLTVHDGDEIRYIPIDAATDYRLKGYIFFSADELLKGRRRCKNFWIASPQVEFKYLLVKKVMKRDIHEYQGKRLRYLVEELGDEAYSITDYLFGRRIGNIFISLILSSNWNSINAIFPRLRKTLFRQISKQDPINSIRFRIPELKRMMQRLFYPTGFFIAVLGPDGAGKSTLIRKLREDLKPAFRRSDSFHFRPRVIAQRGSKEPVTAPHAKPPYTSLVSMLKIPFFILDYWLGYLFKIRPQLCRSSLVLFDRYYYDLMVDPLRYRYGGSQKQIRFSTRFIPAPDLVIILDVPAETLIERKEETSVEMLVRQRKAYRQLGFKKGNFVILDGSLPEEKVAENGMEASLDYLQQRYQKRRHIWIKNEKSESLKWLSSVLINSLETDFIAFDNKENYSEIRPNDYDTYGWFSLKDGKEYLLPLGSRWKNVNALGLYNPQRWRTNALKKIFVFGLKSNLSRFFLKKVVIPRQYSIPDPALSEKLLLCHIREILGINDLSFAVFLGTPSPHRKPVLQAVTSDGKTYAYIKVGWNKTTNDLIGKEVEMLNRLSLYSFKYMAVPSLLYSGWWNGRHICVLSSPEERTSAAPRNLSKQYPLILDEIKSFHIRHLSLKKSAFFKEITDMVEQVSDFSHRKLLNQGMSLVERKIGNRILPFHPCHGDFAPWNANMLKDRLFLFDWEYSKFEGVPGWDISHFLIQTKILIKNQSSDKIYSSLKKREMNEPWIKRYMESLNLEIEMFSSLFLLCLLARFSFHVTCDHKNLRIIYILGKLIFLFLLEEESIQ